MIEEIFPDDLRQRNDLIPLRTAFEQAHFPPDDADWDSLQNFKSPAHVLKVGEKTKAVVLELDAQKDPR